MLIYPIDLPYLPVFFSLVKCFVYPASLSCVSHCIDICTEAIKNIKKMHAASINKIADILHINDNRS